MAQARPLVVTRTGPVYTATRWKAEGQACVIAWTTSRGAANASCTCELGTMRSGTTLRTCTGIRPSKQPYDTCARLQWLAPLMTPSTSPYAAHALRPMSVGGLLQGVACLQLTFRTPSDGDPRIFSAARVARTANSNRDMVSLHERRDVTHLCLRSVVWGSCYRLSKPTRSNICPL